ncbi:putative signaling protein [Patescibacteria group bacterium]|nr:putative signaling protein [Patescibacteria group bacterium]
MNSIGKNLHFKLAGYSFLAALGFIAILTGLFYYLELEHRHAHAAISVNQLIDTVEVPTSIAIYANNKQIAEQVLTGLLRNDVVAKAAIISDQGLSMEKSKSIEELKPIIREIISPFGNKKSIGQISVTPSAEFCLQEANNDAINHALSFFALTLLILFVVVLITRSMFSTALVRLSNTLRDIRAGEQERVDLLESNDSMELDGLVRNINKILDELNTKLSTQQALRKQIEIVEKKLRSIFVSTSAGLFLLDKSGNVLICTPTLQKILGYQDTNAFSINGQNFATLFFKEPSQFQQMLQNAMESEQLEAQDLRLQRDTDDNQLWVHCLLSKIIDASGMTRFEGVIFDISKRVASEKAMQYEANHDALTGLLRRNAAEIQLRKHLASERKASTIVLLLDLDGFKKANDTYGHDAGDMVLVETARRLESCVRHNDIVCRLGGDEFLVILFNCSPVTMGFSIAEQIINAIRKPVIIGDKISVSIGISIGLSVFPIHGSNVEVLLKSADEAMYEVKRQGKNGYGIRGKNNAIMVHRPFANK